MGDGTPTFAIPPDRFLDLGSIDVPEITIAGIPYDLGTSYRPGTRFGPEEIRRASRMLIDGHHPHHRVNPTDKMNIVDVGNFDIVQSDVMGSMALIRTQAEGHAHLVVMGGDHSITLPLLQAVYKRRGQVGLLHFDAHLDTWPDNFGGISYGHGNPFYHAIEQGLIDTHRMVQVGIRSPVNNAIMDWTVKQGSLVLSAIDVHQSSIFEVCKLIEERIGDRPTYLTIDIDALDPAFAPGTGTPEIGGLTSWQLQHMVRRIKGNFVGMDVVEVSPPYDHSGITSLAAATLIWEYLSRYAVSN
jgi:agmatinase